ncbi:Dps family protein [Evansella cellulosilytica]|uniref:Ferritin Dps family protein n=1 Tax=Evansella cellulosilytica (strain ATCC 21833 / DSM 2522 / FERM P-1141 / JCM 9156 / N-4) TaxID=649639 RepID=E6TUY8_EVAC2|nr:Dps family protein [Evansella cellulosilytica]ADU28571.1 Ferritin Dps family protein [Evansella cellulosilytica DSM 2522]
MNERKLYEALNLHLANWNIIGSKLRQFHWFVKGPDFFTLHEKFEELYNEATSYVDEIAERHLSIGGTPISTLREFIDNASIEEVDGNLHAKEMVANVTDDFTLMTEELNDAIFIAEENNDHVTADLFISMKASVEKHIWMLKAYLS